MKKRSLLFPASTFPRKPAASAATATSANNSVDSSKVKQNSGLTKSENKNKSSSNGSRDAGATGGGGGGIPRPQLGITTSPSKLAVRTNTSKLVTTTNNNVHEKIVRSASGDSKDSSGPYKLLPPKTVPTVSSYGPSQGQQANMGPGHHPNQLSHQGHIKTGPSVSYDQYKQPPPPASVPISGPGSRAMGPGPPHVTQRTQTPASFIGYMHPAQPTPPPYHQPPQPPSTSLNTSNSNTVGNSSTDSTEDFVNQAPKDELNRIVEKKDGVPRQSIETGVGGGIVGEYNKKVTELQNEVRSLKDLNVRLSEDNKELRDLCCFLDDDRQKGRS